MNNNAYENAVIINAALEDDQIQNIISRIKEQITTNGGEIVDVEDWGRKRLAYMVKKSKIGYYAIFRFNAPPNLITKLERAFVLDEHIIRFLTIKLDKNALEYIEENKKKKREEEDTSSGDDNTSEENEKTEESSNNKNE